jgi:hypothetical protein
VVEPVAVEAAVVEEFLQRSDQPLAVMLKQEARKLRLQELKLLHLLLQVAVERLLPPEVRLYERLYPSYPPNGVSIV